MNRVVLLGASNVTLGFGVITRLLRAGFEGPLDVRAALGHGRSYGSWSTVAVRSLPAIVECGLWDSLRAAPPAPTHALLTDVGNDLMYGHSPERIAGWVETCLQRLSEMDARVIVTRLPIARVERLSAWRYHATRVSFFPLHQPVSWSEMLRRARELDERVADAATRHDATLVTPPLDWYGFDPIHIRWTQRPRAWSSILSGWPTLRSPATGRGARGLPLFGCLPGECRLFGRPKWTRQPVVVRPDASLSLY